MTERLGVSGVHGDMPDAASGVPEREVRGPAAAVRPGGAGHVQKHRFQVPSLEPELYLGRWCFFGLDVVELIIALCKAVLSMEPEFLHESYRESSSEFSRLYLLVWRLYGGKLADALHHYCIIIASSLHHHCIRG